MREKGKNEKNQEVSPFFSCFLIPFSSFLMTNDFFLLTDD
jgi:hypothetical protein